MISPKIENELPIGDVCIVGAGPVGLATALRLEAQGLTVIVLERGSDEPSVAEPAPIRFANRHHAASMATSHPGIGGTSALWGGRCVELDDLDFEQRAHVHFSGWPISHAELQRYYAPALEFLKCSSGQIKTEELMPQDHAVRSTAIERWSEQPDLGPVYRERLKASERVSLLTGAVVTAVELDPSGGRVDHLRARVGEREIRVQAKAFVLAGGGLENGRLLLGLQDARRHRDHLPSATGKFYQGHLTGYVAVLHLNDARAAAHLFFQRDASGHTFRQRFQVSPDVQVKEQLLNTVFWIDALSIADPAHGSGALSFCYMSLVVTGLYRRLSRGLAPTARGVGRIRLRQHLRNLLQDWRWPRDLARVWKALNRERWRRHTLFNPRGRYLLRYHAEQVPDPESRVTLIGSGEEAEKTLCVDYRVTEQDIGSVLRSHEILNDWLKRNDIGHLEYLHDADVRRKAVSDQAFDGFHQIGLARMSADPADGAADPDCRVHGLDNLFLAGSCLFPTGGHANPTLPAVALALRLADHLERLLRQGDGEGNAA